MANCSFFTFAQAWLDGASFARRCVGARRQVEQDEHQAESGGQRRRRRAFVPAGEPPHGLPRFSPPYALALCFFLGARTARCSERVSAAVRRSPHERRSR